MTLVMKKSEIELKLRLKMLLIPLLPISLTELVISQRSLMKKKLLQKKWTLILLTPNLSPDY